MGREAKAMLLERWQRYWSWLFYGLLLVATAIAVADGDSDGRRGAIVVLALALGVFVPAGGRGLRGFRSGRRPPGTRYLEAREALGPLVVPLCAGITNPTGSPSGSVAIRHHSCGLA